MRTSEVWQRRMLLASAAPIQQQTSPGLSAVSSDIGLAKSEARRAKEEGTFESSPVRSAGSRF